MRAWYLAAALLAAGCAGDRPAKAASPPLDCFTAAELIAAAAEPGTHYIALGAGLEAEAFSGWIATKLGRAPANARTWLILWRGDAGTASGYYFDEGGCRRGYITGPVEQMVPAAKGNPA